MVVSTLVCFGSGLLTDRPSGYLCPEALVPSRCRDINATPLFAPPHSSVLLMSATVDWESIDAASLQPRPWKATVKGFRELCKSEFKYKLSVRVLSPFECETITIFLPPDLRFNDEDYSDMSSFELDADSPIALDELQLLKLSDGSYVGHVVTVSRATTHIFSLLGEYSFSRACELM